MSCKEADYDEDEFCYHLSCSEECFSCYCTLKEKKLETISGRGCIK